MANDAARITSTRTAHVYEVRPRSDKRGFDLISDALPFGGLWCRFTDRARIADGCRMRQCNADVIDDPFFSRITRELPMLAPAELITGLLT
jgi:hypothetical protein